MPDWMKYEITSKFNDPDPVGGRRTGPHKGVDLATPLNTAIQPTDKGKVIQAGFDPRLGYFVKVRHSWGVTTYLHGSRVLVKQGDDVGLNTVLMYSGSSGASTGPHLEFRVQTPEGQYVDPAPLITRYRQRASISGRVPPDDPGVLPDIEEDEEGEDGGEFPDIEAEGGGGSRLDQIFKTGGFFDALRSLTPEQMGQMPTTPIRQRMRGAVGIPSEELEDLETRLPSSGLFTQRPAEGRGYADLLRNFGGFGGVGEAEAAYQLPFARPDLGGVSTAARNMLVAMGINPERGNPYAAFLEGEIPRMFPQAVASRWMRGEPTNQRQIAQDITETLQRGDLSVTPRQSLIQGLQGLERSDEELNEPQRSLVRLLAQDPGFRETLLVGSLNLPGALGRAASTSYKDAMARWQRQAMDPRNEDIIAFARKYLE